MSYFRRNVKGRVGRRLVSIHPLPKKKNYAPRSPLILVIAFTIVVVVVAFVVVVVVIVAVVVGKTVIVCQSGILDVRIVINK